MLLPAGQRGPTPKLGLMLLCTRPTNDTNNFNHNCYHFYTAVSMYHKHAASTCCFQPSYEASSATSRQHSTLPPDPGWRVGPACEKWRSPASCPSLFSRPCWCGETDCVTRSTRYRCPPCPRRRAWLPNPLIWSSDSYPSLHCLGARKNQWDGSHPRSRVLRWVEALRWTAGRRLLAFRKVMGRLQTSHKRLLQSETLHDNLFSIL